MFCPYCGERYGKDEYITAEQRQYARRVAKEKVTKYTHDEVNKMLRRAFGGSSGNSLIKLTVKTSKYHERPISAHYRERNVDSALTCHECSVRFQVDGIFGFCPKCKAQQIRVYDANLAIIRREVEHRSNTQRSLRHAYAELVSTFELLCKRRAKKVTTDNGQFQSLEATRQFFQDHSGVDVFSELSDSESMHLRRVFQKRHLYTHGTEVIDERYIKHVREDAHLLGKAPTPSLSEFEAAADALRKVIDRIVLRTQ